MRSLAVVALLLTATALPAAPKPKPAAGPAFWATPFGVIDGANKTGYIINDKGNVEAVNLADGKVKWTSTEKGRPLALVGGNLVIQANDAKKGNAVRVVLLDAKGKKTKESDAITFPDWVSTGTTHGRSFASTAWVDGDTVYLNWVARAWYAGGARPTPAIEKAARKNADGVAKVATATGKVTMLETKKAPTAPAPKVSEAITKAAGRQVWTGTGSETRVNVSGKYAVVAEVDVAGKTQTAKLDRWELATGKKQETMKLMEGRSLTVQLSTDAAMVLVNDYTVPSGVDSMNLWYVYSVETGKEVGKFERDQGATMTTAIGMRAYAVVQGPAKGPRFGGTMPQYLRAYDIKTGKKVWERSLEGKKMLLPLP